MAMNIQQLRAQIAALQNATMDENRNFLSSYHEGKFDALSAVDALLASMQEEPVGEDLDDAAFNYAEACKYEGGDKLLCVEHFKAGAQWKEEQVKKNLIAYCDNLTKEQVQVNYDFVADRLKKSSRTPSYIDAIEYGKNIVLAELEKIVKNKEEAGKNYVFVFSEVKELVKKMSQKG